MGENLALITPVHLGLSPRNDLEPPVQTRQLTRTDTQFLRDPGPYGIQPEKRAAVRNLRVPEFYPPIRDLVVGNDGTLWLSRWPVGRTRSWLVLDERGNRRGRVELPATLRVHAASTTQVWGTQPDRDGIPSIVRYRVMGAPPR